MWLIIVVLLFLFCDSTYAGRIVVASPTHISDLETGENLVETRAFSLGYAAGSLFASVDDSTIHEYDASTWSFIGSSDGRFVSACKGLDIQFTDVRGACLVSAAGIDGPEPGFDGATDIDFASDDRLLTLHNRVVDPNILLPEGIGWTLAFDGEVLATGTGAGLFAVIDQETVYHGYRLSEGTRVEERTFAGEKTREWLLPGHVTDLAVISVPEPRSASQITMLVLALCFRRRRS